MPPQPLPSSWPWPSSTVPGLTARRWKLHIERTVSVATQFGYRQGQPTVYFLTSAVVILLEFCEQRMVRQKANQTKLAIILYTHIAHGAERGKSLGRRLTTMIAARRRQRRRACSTRQSTGQPLRRPSTIAATGLIATPTSQCMRPRSRATNDDCVSWEKAKAKAKAQAQAKARKLPGYS